MANKADRVASQRAAEQRTAAIGAARAGSDARRNEIHELALQAGDLIPQALSALEARGFPGLLQLEVFLPRTGLAKLGGADRLAKVGAYPVSPYDFDDESARRGEVRWVHLLSQGRLSVGTGSHSIREFELMVVEHEGLGERPSWGGTEPFSTAGLRALVSGLTALRDAA